jgi:hypothetical protein
MVVRYLRRACRLLKDGINRVKGEADGTDPDEMIRTSFFRFGLYGIRPCVSSQEQPHDVVGVNIWLGRGVEVRKGKEPMTVNQEFAHAGRADALERYSGST